ncbi:MAG: TlpA family protein disulfide reductase [Sphingobacterium sp.]
MKNLVPRLSTILFIFCIPQFSMAQSAPAEQHAHLTIEIDETLLSKGLPELDIKVYSELISHQVELHDSSINAVVEGNTYEILLPLRNDLSFITTLLRVNGRSELLHNRNNVLLIEPNDSLVLHLGDKIQLSGKGNNKNIIRQRLQKIGEYSPLSWTSYYLKHRQPEKYFAVQNDYYDSLREQKGITLNRLKNTHQITESAYDYIQDEMIFEIEEQKLRDITMKMKPSARYKSVLGGHSLSELSDRKEKNEAIGGFSYKYLSYLMYLIAAEINIPKHLSSDSKYYPEIDFIEFYDHIQGIHHKDVREKLYLIFLNRYINNSFNGKPAVDLMIEDTENPAIREHLETMRARRYESTEVFPFEFEDINGKLYYPKDFQGKKVVLDFWFTGCGGCITLNKIMKNFHRELDSSNTIFATVNVDKKRETWQKSLQSGEYTNEYTENYRLIDPVQKMLSFYEYSSFPQLLIIDEHGHVLEYNVPIPNTTEKKEKFKSIIQGDR